MTSLLVLFGIGFIASFFGSLTSGAVSIISLTLMQLVGLSALPALVIFRVGIAGFQVGGLALYIKAKRVVWRRELPLILVGAAGAYVGGKLILSIDESVITKVIGYALFAMLPLLLLQPNVGVKKRKVGPVRNAIGYVLHFFNSVWGSSFAIGAGILDMLTQTYMFGMTQLEVKGSNKLPRLVKDIIVLALFTQAGLMDWSLGGAYLAGMVVGAVLGARYAIKLGDVWLRRIFLATVGLVALIFITGLGVK